MLSRKQSADVLAFDAKWRVANGIGRRTLRYVLYEKRPCGEVEFVTVAVKIDKETGRKLAKDVARRSSADNVLRIRDLAFYGPGGWIVCWNKDDLQTASFKASRSHGVSRDVAERSDWCEPGFIDDFASFPMPYDPVVNPELLQKTKYKWCGYDPKAGVSVAKWIGLWRKWPKVELLGKAGIGHLARTSVLKRMEADKAFMRFVSRNVEECRKASAAAVAWAYLHGVTVEKGKLHACARRELRLARFPKSFMARCDEVFAHLQKMDGVSTWEYSNYARYAVDAGWDCEDEHVLFPPVKRFRERLEFAEKCAHEAAKKRKAMARREKDRRIGEWADVYSAVAEIKGEGGLAAALPRRCSEFKAEGAEMGNCIGSMGYDEKVASGKSVIVFVRKNGKPFADLEIGLDEAAPRIRQLYCKRNSAATPEANAVAKRVLECVKREIRRRERCGSGLSDRRKIAGRSRMASGKAA